MMNTRNNTQRKSAPAPEYVDCIVFSILKEEKDLFIKFAQERDFFDRKVYNHPELTAEKLSFIDRDYTIRTCVICSLVREENIKQMGNAAAYKLLYIISRYYKSNFYINIGVAGAFSKKANLGDVFLVVENICVTKKDSNGNLSQNTSAIERSIVQNVFDKIKDNNNTKLCQLITDRIKVRLDEVKRDKDICDLLNERKITLTDGILQKGRCITFPYVLKNKEELLSSKEMSTLNEWDIVDMEAYYFIDWFLLMRKIDFKHCSKNSELLIVKSPSDTCEEALKHRLSKARGLAMGNISEYLSVYLSEIHEFQKGNLQIIGCEEYLCKEFNIKDMFPCLDGELNTTSYDALFSLVAETPPSSDSPFSILDLGKEMEDIRNSIIITGGPGKGENILLALIYKSCSKKKLYIDFARVLEDKHCNVKIICKCLLYIFNQTPDHYGIFLANLDCINCMEDARRILQILDSCKDKFAFCVTYNANSDKTDYQFIAEIKQKINANKEIIEITLNNICSYNKDAVNRYIECYADLFLPNKTEEEKGYFIKNCNRVISYRDVFKKEIKHVDWQLMQLFSNFDKMFMRTGNLGICEIIDEYCAKNDLNAIVAQAMGEGNIDSRSFGRLGHNVYCRAFTYARYLYQILLHINENINALNRYVFYLSDSIDYFMQYLLAKSGQKEQISNAVLENIGKVRSGVQHELLYLISKNMKKDDALYSHIKKAIYERISVINLNDIKNDESGCEEIITYRTYALCLKDFGNVEYLQLFVEKLRIDELFQRVNLSFYLNYYSQKEFTNSDVVSLSKQVKGKISGVMLHNSLYKLIRILDEKKTPFDAESHMYYYTLKSLEKIAGEAGLREKINRFPNINKIQDIDAKFNEGTRN